MNDALSVAILTWEYPPAASGLPRAAREVAQALAGAGHHVRVVTLDREGVMRDGDVGVHGVAHLLTGRRRWLRRRAAIGHLAAPLAFRDAVRALHAARPLDVVEATNWHAPGALVGAAPLVTRCSTPAGIGWERRRGLRERLDGWAVDRLERAQARRSAGLVSNTAPHRAHIRASYGLGGEGNRDGNGAPHHAVAPPVDPAMVARGAIAPYPADDGPIRFLFVGRPDRRKGFDAIADAVRRAPPEPGWRIDMAGTGPDGLPGDLRGSPLVTAHGRVSDDALHALMVDAHAVLAPSRSESFGYVYQEAMAFGRPLVACAEDASARSFVGEPGAGLLARHCTGADVAKAMLRIAREPDLRATLRRNALAAAGGCTRERCAAETIAVYRRALARA